MAGESEWVQLQLTCMRLLKARKMEFLDVLDELGPVNPNKHT